MPTGSVGHQENEKREEIQDEHNQHPPPPALPITEPPQLDTDENDCKKEKKILQVDNSNLIEEATRELDENGNELPKQIPFVEEQLKSEEHQQQEQQPSDKSKTKYLIRLLSILRKQFRSKRASYELQSSEEKEAPCGAGLRFWNRGKSNEKNDFRRREDGLANINNEPGTNVQIRYRTTDSL